MSESGMLYQYRYFKSHAKCWSEWFGHDERHARDAAVMHWLGYHPTIPVQTRDLRAVVMSGALTQADLFPDGNQVDWAAKCDHGNDVADQIEVAAYHIRMINPGWGAHLVRCADQVTTLTEAAERVLLSQHRGALDELRAALVPFRSPESAHDKA